jgi:hypothetical protein
VAFSDFTRRIASQHGSQEGAWGLEEDEVRVLEVVVHVVVSEHELVLRFVSIAAVVVEVVVVAVVAVELVLSLSKSSASSSMHGCMVLAVVEEEVERGERATPLGRGNYKRGGE